MAVGGVGAIACVASVFRVYYAVKLHLNTNDYNFDAYPLFIWSTLELQLGIICGCAPVCKALIKSRIKLMTQASSTKNASPGAALNTASFLSAKDSF
jgi:hypothetical protein